MITLSDELKLNYEMDETYNNTVVGWSFYLSNTLIYRGIVYYTGPSYIHYKDLIEPYVNEYQWIKSLGHTTGFYEFRVRLVFDNGYEFESDVIRNVTEIPTVQFRHIPSIIPPHPTEEFPFGWLCPTPTTRISTSNSTSDVIPEFSNSTTGHTMIKGTDIPKTGTGIYRLTNQAQKLAEFNTHDSRFYLIWITRNNEYMCRPFCRRSDLKETVSTTNVYTFDGNMKPYTKSSTYAWTLNSDWLTYDEHNVYESLMVSPLVYLYDNETGRRYTVNVTDSEWNEKNSNNNKRPFNLTVRVELTAKNNMTY